jgi:DNA-binding XRE family transcriptional regulator
MSKNKPKQLAEALYLRGDMSQKDIAKYVGVTEKTIGEWKEDGNWEEIREAKTLTKDEVVSNLYRNAYDIQVAAAEANRTLTVKETDQIIKIATSIEKLDKSVSIHQMIQVFKDFNVWMVEVDLTLAKEFSLRQKEFLRTKIKG